MRGVGRSGETDCGTGCGVGVFSGQGVRVDAAREADFRRTFGVQVLAIEQPDGTLQCPPDLNAPLQTSPRLVAVVPHSDPAPAEAAPAADEARSPLCGDVGSDAPGDQGGFNLIGRADLVEITIDGDIVYSLIKLGVDGTVTIDGTVSNTPITVGDDADIDVDGHSCVLRCDCMG